MSIFSNLPLDIVNIILSYDNIIRFRNGKYIDQIARTDPRKKMLEKINMKYEWIWIPDNSIMVSVVLHINRTKYYSLQYDTCVLSIATLEHSGIDYLEEYPTDSDESTLMLTLEHVLIQ